ncbi:O-antigen polymerase [Thermoclostridium stercorarium subsp. stercorarium DSM 8532]|jgi:O-antigen ligase|uniref:O-antigen polymerase n=1 Tax=Thermoclostridium stercorarium (strain ATCC 35414 / DSM 8532 / NCIMB 11754) TaxID=1121335 RepID=L7VKC6_THES1|nr:O-antigen ligase family protein [Thermoclostridium stercorarium]AGC67109.1 O-antigen polymerase [Thermoclostridium stercorarium subsp. stercorarium DSM 8532]AGI38189.1 O-antigen ligase [Thermoclostridium stercorarium subsp. stercorarium DSM 8532]
MSELTGKKDKLKKYRYIPFIIITVLIPLAKYRIRVYHNEEIKKVLLRTQWYDDYYCLIKVLLLYLAVFLMLVAYTFRKNEDKKFPAILYFLIPYNICLLLSVCFSDYKITALFGIVDMYEGGLTQLCYCCILLFSYYLISDPEDMIAIIKMALAASVAVTVPGVLEFSGVLPLEQPNTLSSTIGNSNYVGTYGAVLLPVAVAVVLIEANSVKQVTYFLFFFGSAFFLLSGSASRAGYLAVFATIPFVFAVLRRAAEIRAKWMLAFVLYGLCIFLSMNLYKNGLLWEEIKSMNPFKSEQGQDRLIFKDIKLQGASAAIETNRWFLRIENTGDGFKMYNESGGEIPVQKDENTLKFLDEPYTDITGYVDETTELSWLMLEIEGKDIEFVLIDGKMKVVGYNGQITDIFPVESFGFKGKESFASGRGYIWSRAIPLLKKAAVIGYGPDTFTFIFPQNDIVGKLNYGAIWAIIGKPHNWYLQVALGSGIVSLLCLISIFAWYIIKTLGNIVKALKKGEKSANGDLMTWEIKRELILTTGILVSVMAYLISGLFNDSMVAVSPLFWMLLGFGISLTQRGKDAHPEK